MTRAAGNLLWRGERHVDGDGVEEQDVQGVALLRDAIARQVREDRWG
ncbi:MAG: hypothetical protein QN122_12750 [Armatimonadota bacterium]|nr:hypothetical protein [Armatimonadota bacterium]MDR7459794.1 hypothetical protein [Armatimonadota bacterium]MDR7480275.1 hypothetical protein [Armatimonadota bacterium]MDR7488710.1 hypothetical protein [Armatimonadota bacterium]MDR7492305.1 hypothetical protein [Armatimonadota bacterium]